MEQGLIILIAVAVALIFVIRKKKKDVVPDIKKETPQVDEVIKTEEIKTEFPVMILNNGKESKGVAKMKQQGLQVFDENGNCVLDVTDRLCKVLGVERIQNKKGKISIDSVTLKNMHVWFIPLAASGKPNENPLKHKGVECSYMEFFEIKEDGIYWDIKPDKKSILNHIDVDFNIMYGVF